MKSNVFNKSSIWLRVVSLIGIFLLSLSFLLGCKNVDTYKNSYYFKDNNSSEIKITNNISSDVGSVSELAHTVMPAVVAILATKSNGATSIGSGVCVKSGGYILTNSHVVNGAKTIDLYFSGNKNKGASNSATAILLWEDIVMDIAILKSNVSIPYLSMADSEYSDIGQTVLAIGTPFSLNFNHTVTKGIISALNRSIKVNTLNGDAIMQNLIQHDASINPGNSGGPIIDLNGQVVGINTIKITAGEGMGFAIPINSVVSIVENVYKDFNYKTPFLGIFGFDNQLNSNFSDSDFMINDGLFVESVKEDSPAFVAGIRVGDIVTKINNQVINNATMFRKVLFQNSANDLITMTVLRDGKVLNFKVLLSENMIFSPDDNLTVN